MLARRLQYRKADFDRRPAPCTIGKDAPPGGERIAQFLELGGLGTMRRHRNLLAAFGRVGEESVRRLPQHRTLEAQDGEAEERHERARALAPRRRVRRRIAVLLARIERARAVALRLVKI